MVHHELSTDWADLETFAAVHATAGQHGKHMPLPTPGSRQRPDKPVPRAILGRAAWPNSGTGQESPGRVSRASGWCHRPTSTPPTGPGAHAPCRGAV